MKNVKRELSTLLAGFMILLVGFSGQSRADTASPYFNIMSLSHQYTIFGVYIMHDLGAISCGCTYCDAFYLRDTTVDGLNYKNKMPLVMAAFVAGKRMSVSYNGCSNGGTSGYPLVTQIAVSQP